jgi:hypothetical protein
MNTIARLTILLCLCSDLIASDPPTDSKAVARPPDGTYEPDPKVPRFAWEVIVITGSRFRWSYFTDAISHRPPDREGPIRFFSGYIILDEPHITPSKRIPGIVGGVPVLWEERAYEEWKKTRKIDAHGILYRKDKKA